MEAREAAEVTILNAFGDNYIYLIACDGRAAVVDPGDADVVTRAIEDRSLSLDVILLTHHHADHIAGCRELAAAFSCPVIGPDDPRITGQLRSLDHGDSFSAVGIPLTAMWVPGHTSTHIAFYSREECLLMCGDALFCGGCGRIFEGSASEMFNSLQTLAALPAETRVFPGHEYTLANYEFAASVCPRDPAVLDRLAEVRQLRKHGMATVPSTLGEELRSNLFLRCGDPVVSDALAMQGAQPEQVFAELRRRKDRW